MSHWIVKLTRDRGQTRVTLPRLLIAEAGLEDAELVRLDVTGGRWVVIREYHGKGNEKGDLQKDQA